MRDYAVSYVRESDVKKITTEAQKIPLRVTIARAKSGSLAFEKALKVKGRIPVKVETMVAYRKGKEHPTTVSLADLDQVFSSEQEDILNLLASKSNNTAIPQAEDVQQEELCAEDEDEELVKGYTKDIITDSDPEEYSFDITIPGVSILLGLGLFVTLAFGLLYIYTHTH